MFDLCGRKKNSWGFTQKVGLWRKARGKKKKRKMKKVKGKFGELSNNKRQLGCTK